MSEHIQLACNPVVAQLRGASDQVRLQVNDLLSYFVEGYEHMDAYQEKRWDGKSTFFEWNRNLFPSGFVPSVVQLLIQQGHKVQILKQRLPECLGERPTPENPIVDSFAADDRYDYQFKAPALLEKHGTMIARVATGGGKSRIARLCIQRIGRKTLFITTRTELLYQFADACVESGMRVSMCGDSEWDTSGDVVCAMVQTLAARITAEDPRADELLSSIEFVIGEEAHEAGSNSYYEILKRCRKAHYRLALTGTPMMRDSESNMRLLGSFGPVRLEVTERMLIDRGVLATPKFKFVTTKAPSTLRPSSSWQKAVDLGIVHNHERNRAIAFEAIRASRYGLPAVILVSRRAHGDLLKKMLKDAGIRTEFIFGQTAKAKRREALQKLASGQIQVLIGSTIIDVGVDVPALSMVILAGGGKAEVAHRQRIGRTLREKRSGPNIGFVVDFNDTFNRHLKAHALTRRAIVDATDGFYQNVMPDGVDFDFEALGFPRLEMREAA